MEDVIIYNQFAPVAPVHILRLMLEVDPYLFGEYHLFLAHHTVEKPEEFRALMSARQHLYRHKTVIMDNSLVELGGAVDTKMIKEACEIVKVNGMVECIPVLPDVMGKSKETIWETEIGYEQWARKDVHSEHGWMLVTQGETWEAFTKLVDYFFIHHKDKYPNIRWVGIPRKLVGAIQSRARAVQYIQMVAPHVKIHLLGFSEHITDDLFCARMPGVRGIDSAVPVRYHGLLCPTTTEEEIGKRGSWWEDGKFLQRNADNVRAVRSWLNVRGSARV